MPEAAVLVLFARTALSNTTVVGADPNNFGPCRLALSAIAMHWIVGTVIITIGRKGNFVTIP